MPNKLKPDRKRVCYALPVELVYKLRRYADKHSLTVNEIIEGLVYGVTKDIELTPEDYKAIYEEVKKNENRNY